MKEGQRTRLLQGAALRLSVLLVAVLAAVPALAQDATATADEPVGTAFKWLNFVLVLGGLAYLVAKLGGPHFRGQTQAVSASISQAAEAHAAAERELREASERLATLDRKVEELRQVALRETAAEAERIRALARSEAEKIAQAGRAEIEAAERAARQELCSIAARLATERAAALIRERMNARTEAALFRTFVGELTRSAR